MNSRLYKVIQQTGAITVTRMLRCILFHLNCNMESKSKVAKWVEPTHVPPLQSYNRQYILVNLTGHFFVSSRIECTKLSTNLTSTRNSLKHDECRFILHYVAPDRRLTLSTVSVPNPNSHWYPMSIILDKHITSLASTRLKYQNLTKPYELARLYVCWANWSDNWNHEYKRTSISYLSGLSFRQKI